LLNTAKIEYDTITEKNPERLFSITQYISDDHEYKNQVTVTQKAIFDIPPLFEVGLTIVGKEQVAGITAKPNEATIALNHYAELKPALYICGTNKATEVSIDNVTNVLKLGFDIPSAWERYYDPENYTIVLNEYHANRMGDASGSYKGSASLELRDYAIGIYAFNFSATMITTYPYYGPILSNYVWLEVIGGNLLITVEIQNTDWCVRLNNADIAVTHGGKILNRFAAEGKLSFREYRLVDNVGEYDVSVYVPYGYTSSINPAFKPLDRTWGDADANRIFTDNNGEQWQSIKITIEPVPLPFYRDIAPKRGGVG
jgi:hypothetical protein